MNLLAHSRSPGKLILSGEHATVYGKNAVAITVDLFTEVKVYSSETQQVSVILRNFNFEIGWSITEFQQYPLLVQAGKSFVFSENLLELIKPLLDGKVTADSINIYNSCITFLLLYLSVGDISIYAERKAIRVEVSSKMPNGAGLGSSSSYIVSLANALFTAHNVTIEKKDFNQWCYEMDKLFHGKPSGIDNSICTYGGAILFGSGQIKEHIESKELTDLADTPVILVNTNVSRNTKVMVERCRKRLDTFPQIVDNILESIANISQTLWHSLKSKNLSHLPILFEMNQNLLNCLDVGHEKIDQIIAISKRYGLTSKLTGAGGGGIVLVYLADQTHHEKELIAELNSQGFSCYQVKLGVTGVHTVEEGHA